MLQIPLHPLDHGQDENQSEAKGYRSKQDENKSKAKGHKIKQEENEL